MKNLKKFATTAEYNTYVNGLPLNSDKFPVVAYINDTRETKIKHWLPYGYTIVIDDFDGSGDILSFINHQMGDRFVFIDEVVFDDKYLWLWYCYTYTIDTWSRENLPNYILTVPFNNRNDMYEHCVVYDVSNRYNPIVYSLGNDLDHNPYMNLEGAGAGWKPSTYNGKVITYIPNDINEEYSAPFDSPYNDKVDNYNIEIGDVISEDLKVSDRNKLVNYIILSFVKMSDFANSRKEEDYREAKRLLNITLDLLKVS